MKLFPVSFLDDINMFDDLIINPQICLSHETVFLRNYQAQLNETFLCLPSGSKTILVPLPIYPPSLWQAKNCLSGECPYVQQECPTNCPYVRQKCSYVRKNVLVSDKCPYVQQNMLQYNKIFPFSLLGHTRGEQLRPNAAKLRVMNNDKM